MSELKLGQASSLNSSSSLNTLNTLNTLNNLNTLNSNNKLKQMNLNSIEIFVDNILIILYNEKKIYEQNIFSIKNNDNESYGPIRNNRNNRYNSYTNRYNPLVLRSDKDERKEINNEAIEEINFVKYGKLCYNIEKLKKIIENKCIYEGNKINIETLKIIFNYDYDILSSVEILLIHLFK